MKKVIIVDDERSGRDLIKQYIADYTELVLVGEANNGVDAVKIINEFKPDLVFMDIQMPGFTGFEVLVRIEEIPQIIFSTAYDEYALDAFEVHAIDYLLKPYTKDRFKKAIEKADKQHKNKGVASLTESLIDNKKTYPERILVNKNKRLIIVEVEEISWVEAYGDYSKLHNSNGFWMSNYGISTLAAKLDPQLFKRVHRSSIINIKHIKHIFKIGKSYQVELINGGKVRVSIGYIDQIKALIF